MTIISHIFNSIWDGRSGERTEKDLLSLLEEFFNSLNQYIDKQILEDIYKKLLNTDEDDYNILKEKMALDINNYINKKQFFHIQKIITDVMNGILDQKIIQDKFQEMFLKQNFYNNSEMKFCELESLINSEDFNSSFTLEVDQNCNFYIHKSFYKLVKQEYIDKEIQIFQNIYNLDDSNIPNFVIHYDNCQNSNIDIPFFPNQTLHFFLSQKNNEKFLTCVDKIVIMKEIAIGLNQLHKNGIFHQNLNSYYIFLSRKKDAYIGSGFAYDIEFEHLQSKVYASSFYRDPELFSNQQNESKNEYEIIKDKIKHDIYSYGILLYEIVTKKHPMDLLKGRTKKQMINTINDNYFQFLFDQFRNIDFDEYFEIKGIKKIIEKCMRINSSVTQNVDFQSIITDIEHLELYQKNKEEIEYRIKNADSTNTYKCTFADIVLSYFQGNEFSLQIIQSLIQRFQNQTYNNLDLQNISYDELLKIILDFFGFRNAYCDQIDNIIFFEKKIDSIIDKAARNSIETNNIFYFNNQHSLTKFSLKENEKSSIFPIASLAVFFNAFDIKKYSILYIYIIARELSLIHSKNMFHGDLSFDSIGVYFNVETSTFLPLIVPFYMHFSSNNRKKVKYRIIDINKEQQKDIKNFIKIIKRFDENLFLNLNGILDFNSIDEFVYEVYNIILRTTNDDMKRNFSNNMNYRYSSFHFNFRTLYNLFINPNKNDQIHKILYSSFVEHPTYFHFENALHEIIDYTNKMILHYNKSYKNNQNENEHDIRKLLLMVNNNNKTFFEIYDAKINQLNEMNSNDKFTMQPLKNESKKHFNLLNYSMYEINFRENKNKDQLNNYVNRTLEITEIELKSIQFLIHRYINMLNPKINYKLTLKITNRSLCVRQNQQIKLSDIEKIVKHLNYKYEICNGTIVVDIKKSESF